MGEFSAVQLKRCAEFLDALVRDCADLHHTDAMDEVKRGAAADDTVVVLRSWLPLYHGAYTSFAKRGYHGARLNDEHDLPKGKPIKDTLAWLRRKVTEAERAIAALEKESVDTKQRKDRRPLNVLRGQHMTLKARAERCIVKLERMYEGEGRGLNDIARDAQRKNKRGSRPHASLFDD